MNPDDEVGIGHSARLCRDELEEMLGLVGRAEYAKAWLTIKDIQLGVSAIGQVLENYVSQADVNELAATGYDSPVKMKWKEENKEYLDMRARRAEEVYTRRIINSLFGTNDRKEGE